VCGGEVDFDTDTIGRSLERCRVCGNVKYLAAAAVRPDGEGYTARENGIVRRERRPRPSPLDDADIDRLRMTRAARDAAPMNPALAEAKLEFDALLAREKEARKPGRPKKFNVGRPRAPRNPRGPVEITDLEDPPPPPAPRRPPTAVTPPTIEPAMPRGIPKHGFVKKGCERSGVEFQATGSRSRYCGKCPQCVAAAGGTKPSKRETKPAKPDTKRTPASTGFKPRPRSSNGGGYSSVLDDLQEKLRDLDAQRVKLVAAIAAVRNLDGATE
jgi:hypothetical protein